MVLGVVGAQGGIASLNMKEVKLYGIGLIKMIDGR